MWFATVQVQTLTVVCVSKLHVVCLCPGPSINSCLCFKATCGLSLSRAKQQLSVFQSYMWFVSVQG